MNYMLAIRLRNGTSFLELQGVRKFFSQLQDLLWPNRSGDDMTMASARVSPQPPGTSASSPQPKAVTAGVNSTKQVPNRLYYPTPDSHAASLWILRDRERLSLFSRPSLAGQGGLFERAKGHGGISGYRGI